MSEKIRLAGIVGLIAALIVLAIFKPDMLKTEFGKTLMLLLAGLIGAPIGAKAVRRQLARKQNLNPDDIEGLKWTWDEWHAFVCGLFDGLGWQKAEPIPETSEGLKEGSMQDILFREAWYYKAGYGIGRWLWVPSVLLIIWLAGRTFG